MGKTKKTFSESYQFMTCGKQKSFLIFSLFVFCVGIWAEASFYEDLLLHEIEFEQVISSTDSTIGIFVMHSTEGGSALDKKFLSRMIKVKLRKAGYRSTVLSSRFAERFYSKEASPSEIISPKLVLKVEIKRSAGLDLIAECIFSYIAYQAESKKKLRYIPQLKWSKRFSVSNLSFKLLERDLLRALQKEMFSLLNSAHFRSTHRGSEDSRRVVSQREAYSQYSLEWRDRESKHRLMAIGLTGGTPSLLNAHVAYWGSVRFPIVAALSGMYLGAERRGIQLDLGWGVDRTGDWKQVAGLSFVRVNETFIREIFDRNERGYRVLKKDVANALSSYLGPSYTVAWKNIRFQAGWVFALGTGPQKRSLPLLQIGFVPSFLF